MASPHPAPSQEPYRPGPHSSRSKGTRASEASVGVHPSVGRLHEPPHRLTNGDVREFVALLLAGDESAALDYSRELIDRGLSVEELFEGVFAESARELGSRWVTDDCSFFDVTLGTGCIQRLVREFSQVFQGQPPLAGTAGRILLTCAASEQHSLGVSVLGEFLVRDGWDVQLGPWLGSEELLDRVRETSYNMIGFSVSVPNHLPKLHQDIRRIRQTSRNRDIRVLVGGSLVNADPAIASRVGADGFACDARAAVREARRLISA